MYLLYQEIYRFSGTYECKRQGCWHSTEEYKENIDFGYYSTNNSECSSCQNKCSSDIHCGAVECGGNNNLCSWWKVGMCDSRKSPDFFIYNRTKQLYEYGLTCWKGSNAHS